MKTVKKGHKRRCPYCGSNKWEFIGAVPTTPEVMVEYLLVRYKCLQCNELLLAEEEAGSKYVKSAEKCFNCQSRNIEKISKEGADLELFRCKQCSGYMGIEQQDK